MPTCFYAIGNALLDRVCSLSSFPDLYNRTPKGSTELIDKKTYQTFLERSSGSLLAGGAIANSAVALADFKHRVVFSGCIGDDPAGSAYIRDLAACGVTPALAAVKSDATGCVHVFVDPEDKQRTMLTYLGASQRFAPEHVEEKTLARADFLLIEGYLLTTPSGRDSALHAAFLAATTSTHIVLSLDGMLVPDAKPHFSAFLAQVSPTLVIGNQDEFTLLSGSHDPFEALQALQASFASLQESMFVVTLAEKGALAKAADVYYPIEAVAVADLIDMTGAGDAFSAGFLSQLDPKNPAKSNITRAGVAGATLAARVIAVTGGRAPPDNST